MNETGLFVAGTIVTVMVFTGIFLHVMLSFGRWGESTEAKVPND